MKKIFLPVLAGCLMLSACTTPGKRTAIGAGGGAAVGALAGAIIANNTGGQKRTRGPLRRFGRGGCRRFAGQLL